jgi:hypothetical protein
MKVFKTKAATRNAIYKIVSPLTKGIFRDESWQNVNAVWKALRNEGLTVDITDARSQGFESKTWSFSASVNGFYFNGSLVACFCGTTDAPTSRYDICFQIY